MENKCLKIIQNGTENILNECSSKAEGAIIIPDSVTSIGDNAFFGCSGLTSITIPNSVTSIGNNAFYGCSGLKSITIPNSVTSIGNGAFRNCTGLTSITIPDSVTSIGEDAFDGCRGLTSVNIPNSVMSIGNNAFYGCSGLKSITIPNSININDAIDIFTDFLSDANNTNLSQRLPMDLYEYWFASTDSFDRSRYLNDLLIFFEAALKEIYIQLENKEPPRTKGLADMALLFSGLPDMLLYSKDSKGFRRIAHDLSVKRNIVAHGDTLKLSSLETAKLITDYVALYVYIVAKYHK